MNSTVDHRGPAEAALLGGRIERGQRIVGLALAAAVIVADQSTKWWGWRHAPRAIVNTGTTWFIGGPLNAWVSHPVTGAFADGLGAGLLTVAGVVLLRRRRRPLVLVAGALMIGGWSSNLTDRLGLHAFTAPGSSRGAVDWIQLGLPYFNVADFVIIGASLLGLAALFSGRRGRRSGRGSSAGAGRGRLSRRPVAVAAGLVAVVVVGTGAGSPGATHGLDVVAAHERQQTWSTAHRAPVRRLDPLVRHLRLDRPVGR